MRVRPSMKLSLKMRENVMRRLCCKITVLPCLLSINPVCIGQTMGGALSTMGNIIWNQSLFRSVLQLRPPHGPQGDELWMRRIALDDILGIWKFFVHFQASKWWFALTTVILQAQVYMLNSYYITVLQKNTMWYDTMRCDTIQYKTIQELNMDFNSNF